MKKAVSLEDLQNNPDDVIWVISAWTGDPSLYASDLHIQPEEKITACLLVRAHNDSTEWDVQSSQVAADTAVHAGSSFSFMKCYF